MEAAPVKRRLSAVMIADVAAYSRLMERDEAGTHVRIQALFDKVVRPGIERHGGRLLRTMGDGFIAEYPSATEALQSAIEIQRDCQKVNRGHPEADSIKLRIGLNVADILFDQSDISGGGVNLAARLETLATPGGICISQAFRDQIHQDLGVTYVDGGVRRVKNISKPVRVIRVLFEPQPFLTQARYVFQRFPLKLVGIGLILIVGVVWGSSEWAGRTEQAAGSEKLSVLFEDFRPEDASDSRGVKIGAALGQQVYLILSADRHLLQIRRREPIEVSGPPRPLSARFTLQGFITGAKEPYRIDARLIESINRTVAWSDQFQLKDLSEESIQAAARRVALAVRSEVVQLETKRITAAAPRRPDAMDLVLMGYDALETQGKAKAKQLFGLALELDPTNVPAILGMSYTGSTADRDRLTQQAVSTDPLCADSWAARSAVLYRLGHKQAALDAIDRAVSINPGDGGIALQKEWLMINEGAWAKAVRPLEKIEFEYAKSSWALAQGLLQQCIARVLAEQDAEEACTRSFAESGTQNALAWATAAVSRGEGTEQALDAGRRLKERHPSYSVASHRNQMLESGDVSSKFLAQFDKVVAPALSRAGVE